MDSKEQLELIVKVVQLFDYVPGYRVRAKAIQRLLGHEGRSFEECAKQEGVTKQAMQKIYRKLQKETKIRGRGDKSDPAREKYRKRATGKKRERRPSPHDKAKQLAQKAIYEHASN